MRHTHNTCLLFVIPMWHAKKVHCKSAMDQNTVVVEGGF